jgi:hypothetical protein
MPKIGKPHRVAWARVMSKMAVAPSVVCFLGGISFGCDTIFFKDWFELFQNVQAHAQKTFYK